MHRIDTPSATVDEQFTEGSPTGGVPATVVSADWLNSIQEEIANVVESAGLTLEKENNEQLLSAIIGIAGLDYLNSIRANVASASAVNLTTGAPNTRHIDLTGTTTINSFTVVAGRCYFVRFTGVLQLTNSASINTQRGANITTAAGDTCIIRATAADTVEILCGDFKADRGIGSGQTWQDVAASRAISTTYTNTTGRPIQVALGIFNTAEANLNFFINAVRIVTTFIAAGQTSAMTIIIPAGSTYSITVSTGSPTINTWQELR
jgi:hypothetical protein